MAEKFTDTDILAKYSKCVTSFQEILECIVCLEVGRVPVKTCLRGHICCTACAKRLHSRRCPLCQRPFFSDSLICINNLLDALPRPCCFSQKGCRELVVLESGDEHEDHCGYRSALCVRCDTRVEVRLMASHYDENHAGRVLKTLSTEQRWPDFLQPSSRSMFVPAVVDGHYFCITFQKDPLSGNLHVIFEAFYICKPKVGYFLCVKLEKGEFVHEKTIKPIVRKGIGERDNSNQTSELDKEAFCMTVSRLFFWHYVDAGNSLNISLKFVKS